MRKLIYSISVSLDGYINDARGSLNWVRVDEEYHRFANEQMRETGLSIYGTRMWQTMTYWDTAEDQPGHPEFMYEFARLWKPAPKLVFSHSLADADMRAGAQLRRDGLIEEVTRLKSEPGKPIAVSGATLASALLDAGLVDELQPFIVPVVIGGGVPFLQVRRRLDFELLETRRFASGTVFHRYARRP
ncbi:MAG TPA: dihydrofolate reductase family protein [Devosia sp.]|jgi:dihydrofolate reductase|nr:dihydrofolate reductase family protein [Devosia sp.]